MSYFGLGGSLIRQDTQYTQPINALAGQRMHFAVVAALLSGLIGVPLLTSSGVPGSGSPFAAIGFATAMAFLVRTVGNGRQNTIGLVTSLACAGAIGGANLRATISRLATELGIDPGAVRGEVGFGGLLDATLQNMTTEAWVVYAIAIGIAWTVSYKRPGS